jgi:hypothetical protein
MWLRLCLVALLLSSILAVRLFYDGGDEGWAAGFGSLHERFVSFTSPRRTTLGAPPPIGVDLKCPRFVVQGFFGAGLGHQFAGIVYAARQAQELGAALVIDDAYWRQEGHHGFANLYFRRMLNLYAFVSLEELSALSLPLRSVNASSKQELYALLTRGVCNVVAYQNSAAPGHCGDWCWFAWPGGFAEMHPLFQSLYRPDQVLRLLADNFTCPSSAAGARGGAAARRASCRNVAWHLRVGDLVLHSNDTLFFTNIYLALHAAAVCARGATLHHHFVFEGPKQVTTVPPAGFEMLTGIISNATYISTQHVGAAMSYFVRADILVGSGSSLATAAATIAPARVAYVEVPPKEAPTIGSGPWSAYHLPDAIVADKFGVIDMASIKRLCKRLQQQF